MQFDLTNVYNTIREQGLQQQNVTLSSLTKMSDGTKPMYFGQFQYTKKKAGRIEFLKDDVSSFDFYFVQIDKRTWQVEIDGSKSTDTKELYSLLSENLPSDGFTKELIDESLINDILSIKFFDELAKKGLDKNWNFQRIDHLTVKRGKKTRSIIADQGSEEDVESEGDEADDFEDLDDELFSNEQLTGINQAILQGKDLRDDDFVKSCEERGYRFSAMTYQFEHATRPLCIAVKAEFKGRPKVFEVSITQVQEKTGLDSVRKTTFLALKENRQIRSAFWNNAKKLFKNV